MAAARREAIWFSQAGRCRRQVAYDMLGVPPEHPISQRSRNVMDVGQAVERLVVEKLRGQGWRIERALDEQETVEVSAGGLTFRGRPDGLVLDSPALVPPDQPRALEVKGLTRWGIKEWRGRGLQAWAPEYHAQATLEMAALGVKRAAFVGMARDNGEEHLEDVAFDGAAFEAIVTRWTEAWRDVGRGELPPADYEPGDARCAPDRCQWSALCPSGQVFTAMRRLGASHGPVEDGRGDAGLSQVADLWREGDDLEREGHEKKDGARRAFEAYMTEQGVRSLALTGMSVTIVTQNRDDVDREKAKAILGPRWMEVVKKSVSSYLRVSRHDD